jgi:hypothetical protein
MLSKRPDDALARIQSDRRLKINRNIDCWELECGLC